MRRTKLERRYIEDKYKEKIKRLSVPSESVEEDFVKNCKQLERFLQEEAPKTLVQRLAWNKTKKNHVSPKTCE